VILIGFSGGAAFAGGLILDDPERFAGAAILYGTLPFDAGVPTSPDLLQGVPMFVAQGDADTVIPAELLDATWRYLGAESGADTTAVRSAGGHSLDAGTAAALAEWVTGQLG
jgi:phospholipase/carboxylesterase